MKYDPKKIEKKWQGYWAAQGTFRQYRRPKKQYVLDMFPYPSGAGLHVGHPKGYIATDVYSRFKQLQGYGVLHPMGWDAFGLPAEQYAIKNQVHPAVAVKKNIATFKKQLERIGFTYDWEREINTTDPEYYKWTQWIFLQMFKKGLAYQSFDPINWCPSCQTGLANEDLEEGRCERCNSLVEKRPMRQWVLRITAYADKMLRDLKRLDWPESVKEAQKNWIGRSEGMVFTSPVKDTELTIQTFSAHFEAFAADTFVVIAPDHPLLPKLLEGTAEKESVLKKCEEILGKRERTGYEAEKEPEGIFTGRYVLDPVGNGELPIWVASYVLAEYGTGIVKCSAHDERDFAFAKKYGIRLKPVLFPDNPAEREKVKVLEYGYTDMQNGILAEPRVFKGRRAGECRKEIIEYLLKHKLARKKITYKMRDWVFSRQRYWGEPIPLIHCERCGVVPVPEKDLPVRLPKVNSYEPTGTGESPLAGIKKWIEVDCPSCVEKTNKTKYLIFDFDGVLGDTLKASLEARVRMGDARGIEEARTMMEKYFSAKPQHARGDHFTDELKAKYHDWSYRYAVEKAKIKYKLFDGFIREIQKIKNAKIAVVSAGYDLYSKGPLIESGLEYTHFLAGNHNHSKENKIERVCKAWKVDMKDVYYFTDTQADVYELEGLLDRKKIIGCSWGYQGEKKLKELLPDNQVLKKFSDIHSIWKLHKGRRETNTMPQWAGSSWYYLRYIDPENKKTLVDKKKEKKMMPVDVYVGGDHATRHLIYARFWHKFLYDQGVVSTPEPFKRLEFLGLILAADGRKMSKRWGNVINPDDVVALFGADAFRLYEMFMGPFTQSIAWNTDGVVGTRRFLEKIWKLQGKFTTNNQQPTTRDRIIESLLHKTTKKVGEDIEAFKFNTAISSLMILVNEMEKAPALPVTSYRSLLILLAPFAPHIAEELWSGLGEKKSVFLAAWPKYDPRQIREETKIIGVQVNGKVRGTIELAVDATEAEARALALADPKVQAFTEGKSIRKCIYVPG
ncbi:MAG: leucine--tRNA ligase, partial [Candidatus Moraniibacteriota bacterium]